MPKISSPKNLKFRTNMGLPEKEEPRVRHSRRIKLGHSPTGKVGHPLVYDSIRFPHIAYTLCKEYGFTREQLGTTFGVSADAIAVWLHKYPEFREQVLKGRDEFDTIKVESALLRSALGYTYEEVTKKSIRVRGRDIGENVQVSIPAMEITRTVKEVAPNAKSILYWLSNRNRERWSVTSNINVNGKIDHKHSGTVVTAQLENLNKEQLFALRDIISTSQGAIPVEFQNLTENKDTLQIEHILNKGKKCLDIEGELDEEL